MTTPVAQIVDAVAYAQAVEDVVAAAAAYYTDGTSPLDDDAYDRLVRGIAAWEAAHPDQVLPGSAAHLVEAEVARWPEGSPYSFPGRAKLQPALTRRDGRVLLAGDYLGTQYTETAVYTGLTAAGAAEHVLDADLPARPTTPVPPSSS